MKRTKIQRRVGHLYVEKIDDVEIRYRQKQKHYAMAEISPPVTGESEFDEEIDDEKHADPQLEGHVGPAVEKIDIVERVERYPYDQHHRQYQDYRVEQSGDDALLSGQTSQPC